MCSPSASEDKGAPVARGRLDERARRLSAAERRAIEPWLLEGLNVEALAVSTVPGVKTPDVRVAGVRWEIKTPEGATQHTVPGNIRRGRKQATRVLLDVRETTLTEQQAAEGLAEAVRKYGVDLVRVRISGTGFTLDWGEED